MDSSAGLRFCASRCNIPYTTSTWRFEITILNMQGRFWVHISTRRNLSSREAPQSCVCAKDKRNEIWSNRNYAVPDKQPSLLHWTQLLPIMVVFGDTFLRVSVCWHINNERVKGLGISRMILVSAMTSAHCNNNGRDSQQSQVKWMEWLAADRAVSQTIVYAPVTAGCSRRMVSSGESSRTNHDGEQRDTISGFFPTGKNLCVRDCAEFQTARFWLCALLEQSRLWQSECRRTTVHDLRIIFHRGDADIAAKSKIHVHDIRRCADLKWTV